MHSHLIAVEVGIECCTDEGMKLDGAALDQNHLESLDTQTMQRGRPVQQHRSGCDNVFEHIPNGRVHTIDQTFGALDIVCEIVLDQLAHDKGLEEFQCHFLG